MKRTLIMLLKMPFAMLADALLCNCRRMPYLDHVSRTEHIRNGVDCG